ADGPPTAPNPPTPRTTPSPPKNPCSERKTGSCDACGPTAHGYADLREGDDLGAFAGYGYGVFGVVASGLVGGADGLAVLVDLVALDGGRDPDGERFLGRRDQLQVGCPRRTDAEAARRVRAPPVDRRATVHVQQVPIL